MHRRIIQRIKKLDELELLNEEIDAFFQSKTLKKILPFPIWSEEKFFIEQYQKFISHFHKPCHYKKAFIRRHKKNFIANIYFQTLDHRKYMLSFVYNDKEIIDTQRLHILSFLHGVHELEVSNVSIPEEDLPKSIISSIRDFVATGIDATNLRLRKFKGLTEEGKTICFHEFHYRLHIKKRSGISILLGFEC